MSFVKENKLYITEMYFLRKVFMKDFSQIP